MAEEPAALSKGEIIVVRTQDAALPTRSRKADAEPVDARLLRAIGSIVPPDLPPISQLGLETALAAMADASKAALASDLDCWRDWCGEDGRTPLPADPEDMVRYVNALDARGRKPATLARRIASLGSIHRLMGLASPAAPITTASAHFDGLASGSELPVRLRVDGIDSPVIDLSTTPPRLITVSIP